MSDEFKDPQEIWLEPACAGNDRSWCEDKLDDCEEPGCGLRAPRYVLADTAEAEIERLRAALEAFVAAHTWISTDSFDGIDSPGRRLLEHADSLARAAFAGTYMGVSPQRTNGQSE